jgi:hypothetical protein
MATLAAAFKGWTRRYRSMPMPLATPSRRASLVSALLLCAAGCGQPQDPEYLRAASQLMKSPDAPQVDPATYRAKIEVIEGLLFRDDPLTPGDRELLRQEFSALGQKILDGNTVFGNVFGRELITLGKRITSTSDPVTRTREGVRWQWQRIRSSLFHDVPWFQ